MGILCPFSRQKKETTMLQPPQDVDTLFEELLQDLPLETGQMAREFKAFTRARKVKTPRQLLRLVLLYCGLDKSRREVAGHFTLWVERITDTSVAERLAACRPWVRALLAQMLPRPDLAVLSAPRRFLVIDASGIQAPGARGTQYRLHLCMEMVTLTFTSITITATRTGESLKHFPLGPGDVAVADRGYCHPEAIVQTVQRGADVLLRLNPHHVPLTQHDGTPLDLVAALRPQAPATICTLPVLIGQASQSDSRVAWVPAYRLPAAQANRARQLCRKRNRKNGHQPQKRTLFLAGWVLVLTSLQPALLPGPTALAVYRVRWQIEVAIKRWKSVLDADLLRARYGSPLADVWLHGKLLYALLLDRRLRRTLGAGWSRLDGERLATWWRPWKLLQDELTPRITGVQSWQPWLWPACLQVLVERPRRRKLQRLPLEVTLGLHGSNTPFHQPQMQDIAA
jgi:Transposase DDE domain